jgi:hypothetical protein
MKKLITICLVTFVVSAASANPVWIYNYPVGGQDWLTIEGMVDELGNSQMFPPNEYITAQWYHTDYQPCLQNPDDPLIPNVEVEITNLTGIPWRDLHYVADSDTSLQNYDINRLNECLAFKIDDVGLNTPLIYESMKHDLIFEPGETWLFVIQDYYNQFGAPASYLGSLGVPSYVILDGSSGSIIAIPEPTTICLLTFGGLALLRKKR